jgi:hypothetical protein
LRIADCGFEQSAAAPGKAPHDGFAQKSAKETKGGFAASGSVAAWQRRPAAVSEQERTEATDRFCPPTSRSSLKKQFHHG